MANELDETSGEISEQGRDVNVIQKQIPVKVGAGSVVFEVMLWVLGIIPGLIFTLCKVRAGTYLRQLQQKIQHDASQIDNYLEQRVQILKNAAKLLDKAIDLDKDVMTQVAAYRSGANNTSNDATRNQVSDNIDRLFGQVNVAFEKYPDLKAHNEIEDCIKQNSYLQKEITAAREVYNDTVYKWNAAIQEWPAKMIVAAKAGYTTRIPYTASKEIKEQARGTFF
jgi:LemA protein